jgi:hypothetical protein
VSSSTQSRCRKHKFSLALASPHQNSSCCWAIHQYDQHERKVCRNLSYFDHTCLGNKLLHNFDKCIRTKAYSHHVEPERSTMRQPARKRVSHHNASKSISPMTCHFNRSRCQSAQRLSFLISTPFCYNIDHNFRPGHLKSWSFPRTRFARSLGSENFLIYLLFESFKIFRQSI